MGSIGTPINHDGIVDDVIVLEDAMAAIGQGEFESAYHIVRHLVENKKIEISMRRRNTETSLANLKVLKKEVE